MPEDEPATGRPAELSAEVGERVRQLRLRRGLSLSELARRAGLGKGTLSELESGQRNPTLETLYALAAPLGVGLAALIGPGAATGRRPTVHGATVTAILLDVLEAAEDGSTTEVYRLVLEPGGRRVSPAHGPGVREQYTVVSGVAVVGPTGQEQVVAAGQTHNWISDRQHTFRAEGVGPAIGVLLVTHPPQVTHPAGGSGGR